MENLVPIKLPDVLEKEAEEARLQALQERIIKQREENTLFSEFMIFLKEFEQRINTFNLYIQQYTPYSTISKVIKDTIRNKLRELNEFYFSFTGSNPHPLICEFENKNDSKAEELHQLHKKLSDILGILNDNVACISGKQLIYARQTKEIYHTYDWT